MQQRIPPHSDKKSNLYFRHVVLILFILRFQDIRQITHLPEIENNMEK